MNERKITIEIINQSNFDKLCLLFEDKSKTFMTYLEVIQNEANNLEDSDTSIPSGKEMMKLRDTFQKAHNLS